MGNENSNNVNEGTWGTSVQTRNSCGLRFIELTNYETPGKVIVFDHSKYHNEKFTPRNGTENDVIKIKETLEPLGFIVDVHENLTVQQIREKINDCAASENFTNCGSLIIFVLTHGKANGLLCAYDEVYPVYYLWESMLYSENLKAVPKLFFIQACRNMNDVPNREMKYTVLASDSLSTSLSLLPNARDFFIAFSTVEGKISMRNIESGTWFIQNLCKEIRRNENESKDLVSLMTQVICNVSELEDFKYKEDQSKIPNKMQIDKQNESTGQTPIFVSYLDYNIYYRKTSLEKSDDQKQYEIPERFPGDAYIFYDDNQGTESHDLLKATLEKLQFKVTAKVMSDKAKVLGDLKMIAENTQMTTPSVFLVFLTSLAENTLKKYDVSFEECKKPFLASVCAALRSKPKVFMFFNTQVKEETHEADGQGTLGPKLPRLTNDHSDMLQITCYEKGLSEVFVLLLKVLATYKRDNIMNLLTRTLEESNGKSRHLSHIESTFCKTLMLGPQMTDEEIRQAKYNLGEEAKKILSNSCENRALLNVLNDILATYELSEEDNKKLKDADNLRSNGQPAEALQIYEDMLEEQKKVVGNKNLSISGLLHNIAELLGELKRFSEALVKIEECLAIRIEVRGYKDVASLSSMHYKAIILNERGFQKEALLLNSSVLKERRILLGETHVDTLKTMQVRACILRELDRRGESMALSKDILEKQKQTIGCEHVDTFTTLHNFALVLRDLRKYTEALAVYNECIEKRTLHLGTDHKDTLHSMFDKAYTLGENGNRSEALGLHRLVLEKRYKLLGESHRDTMHSKHSIAYTLREMGDYVEARKMYDECLHEQNYFLGETHEDTLCTVKHIKFLNKIEKKSNKAVKIE